MNCFMVMEFLSDESNRRAVTVHEMRRTPFRPVPGGLKSENKCTFLLTETTSAALVPVPLRHGLWLSLVERFVRDEEAAGSNPASPTKETPRKPVVGHRPD